MTQFANLSTESQNIVANFFNTVRCQNVFTESPKMLMVSLYSKMPNADKEVLSILNRYLINLCEYFAQDEIARLQAEYAAVIGYCFKQCDFQKGGIVTNSLAATYLPDSLVELCSSLIEPKKGKTILLPFIGGGSFAQLCNDASQVDGFEANAEAWAISQIVLKSVNPKANIVLGDIESLNIEGTKYDYIFAFPPFLMGRDARRISDYIYDLITKHLNDNGEFCAIVPNSFCFDKSGWFDVRKIMFDYKEFSSLVITLPALLQPLTGINLNLVCYAKNHKGMVVLADASSEEFQARKDIAGIKRMSLKVNSILETIRKQDEKYVWVGTASELTNDLDMSPKKYLFKQAFLSVPEGYKYFELRDLVSIIPLKKGNTNFEMPLLGMKELNSSYLNCEIEYDEIPTRPSAGIRALVSDSLLAGFIGGKFKVGRISGLSDNHFVNLRSEVFAFNLKSEVITEDFLLRQIQSEISEKQANMLSVGVAISRLRLEDFLSIKILVPSIEEQNRLCKEDTRVSLTESDRMLLESYEEFRRDMHMKKHAIGQTIYNLKNWWKALQKARKEGNGVVSDTAMVGKSQPVSVAEIYDNLQEVISKLQKQINTLDRGNGLEKKNIALTKFIEDYIADSANQSPMFSYIYDERSHHADQTLPEVDFNEDTGVAIETEKVIINEGDPIEYAEFAPEALKIIFDNIVNNATSHGFEGRENATNYIKFELSTDGDDYVITISNNGNPLHGQLSAKDVFVYNKSSKNGKEHFGIGGYEVQKLMREFGGDAQFISEPDSDFPVAYKLVFKNTNIQTVSL